MPAFSDPASANAWLAAQPQANAPAMLERLLDALKAFAPLSVDARKRFKTLETLRKTLFVVSNECQKRYDGKPLPLLPGERELLDRVQRLWRTTALAYLTCLRALLDRDAGRLPEGEVMAHRVLSCLRLEQMACYLGGCEPGDEFWRTAHAVLVFAEQLGVVRTAVPDRLLGETTESTVAGQYAMLVLMHLARPFSLTRNQLLSASRWFSRWREQVGITSGPDGDAQAARIAIDLTIDQPVSPTPTASESMRWLALDTVLRKIRRRLEKLAAGETPDSLKLGNLLSPEACSDLLRTLTEGLRQPRGRETAPFAASAPVQAFVGLETIHRALGGTPPADLATTSPFRNALGASQIALFDHVVSETTHRAGPTGEAWLRFDTAGGPVLIRTASSAGARINPRAPFAFRSTDDAALSLGFLASLHTVADGSLLARPTLLTGTPRAVVLAIRDRIGDISHHPGILLILGDTLRTLMLPAGIAARARAITLRDAEESKAITLARVLDRAPDWEHWAIS